ncbi:hypothetical protein RKD49_006493 [Streptomyces glaucescens]
MTSNRTDVPHHAPLPRPEELLTGTDWASLETPSGTGEALPGALARFLDTDPAVRAAAVGDALRAVTHQNTVYEATVPVALYVAAVLNHPATAAGESGRDGERTSRQPTRVTLLDWLGDTALDADDECVAIAEGIWGDGFLDECPEIRAFRDLRPAFYSAVAPLLAHEDADVRDAAFVAAVPLVEHPALASHRGELAEHARRLLTTSTDRYRRDRALSALRTWGHDVSGLENADDVAARELRARRAAERVSWGEGGYSEDPPF